MADDEKTAEEEVTEVAAEAEPAAEAPAADEAPVAEAPAAERGKINSKRGDLRKLLTDTHWTAMENVRLIDEVLATTERVLNPGAHGGEAPLYEDEVEIAFDLIKRLEKCLP